MSVVRRELLTELALRYAGALPWLRASRPLALKATRQRFSRGALKAAIIGRLGAAGLMALAHGHGFAQNRRLIGIYVFGGGSARYLALLAGWLACCVTGDLVMSHAACGLQLGDPLGNARQVEYEVLASDAFGRLLQEARIVLAPMRQVLASGLRQG